MNDQTQTSDGNKNALELATRIAVAFVGNPHNHMSQDDVSKFLTATYSTLTGIGQTPASAEIAAPQKKEPATSIRKSVQPDFLVCLHDGKRVTMLKRYLMTNFQQTPDQYRAEFGLPADYPMSAPNYSAKRRELAKSIGLGTKGRRAKETIEALAEVTDGDKNELVTEANAAAASAPKAEATGDAAPKRRGRKPGSKNVAKAPTDAAPKRRGRKPAAAAAAAAA
jgi:predicted transcriptional regulator